MEQLSSTLLLKAALWVYVAGGVGSLLALRRDWLASLIGFGAATLGGLFGISSALVFLLSQSPPAAFAHSLSPPEH